MSAYPWGFTTPDQSQFNLPDHGELQREPVVFQEVGHASGGERHAP